MAYIWAPWYGVVILLILWTDELHGGYPPQIHPLCADTLPESWCSDKDTILIWAWSWNAVGATQHNAKKTTQHRFKEGETRQPKWMQIKKVLSLLLHTLQLGVKELNTRQLKYIQRKCFPCFSFPSYLNTFFKKRLSQSKKFNSVKSNPHWF